MWNNGKIKVLFRHRSMEMGGVEKVVISMLQHLDKNKFEISLLLNLFQGELRNQIPSEVKTHFLAKGKEDLSSQKFIQKIQLLKRKLRLEKFRKNPKLIDKIINEQFDVEIAPTYAAFEAVLSSTNKNSKKIGWFHSDITLPKLQPLVPKILKQIPQFDYFIFGSQQTKDIFVKMYPNIKLPENQVILNAIDVHELKKKSNEKIENFPSKYPVFVSVARLHSRKGIHKLMEVHAKLLQDGFLHEIVIIGDGEERENLKKQAEKLGVTESFTFLGTLINPYPYIKKADFFILPSESESWPLIIAEALLLQKPTISTNVGGIIEMISHKKNGFLINYDVDEMYDAMKLFLTNREIVAKITENLKESEKQFDSKKIFDSVEEIIIKLAKKQVST